MPNNFRLTGNIYVSKTGNDINTGTSPDSPKLTINSAYNAATNGQTIIVGAGVYNETISRNITTANLVLGLKFYADGIVNIVGGTGLAIQLNYTGSNSGVNYAFYNFNFLNHYIESIAGSGGFTSQSINYTDCNFINCNIYYYNTGNSAQFTNNLFLQCKLINCSFTGFTANSAGVNGVTFSSFRNSILINSLVSFNGVNIYLNNYIDSNSVINYINPGTYNATGSNFNFNNIQGKIVMYSNGAVSGVNSNGVALSFAQHRIDYPTYNVNSISADPKFNDAQNLNFTLQSSSPHIKGANDFVSNIGGTEYAVYKSAGSTEFTTGATVSGLTLRGNNSYTITSSPTPGTIETAPIQVQSYPATRPLTKLEWVGSLEFNKSITAGTQGNTNVPDWDTYTTGAGASPDRLTVKMRYSTQSAQPTTSAQWDNGGYWTAGNYELFEINAKPKVDVNGKGNGNPDYVESNSIGDLVPTWIQLSIKLIDTYNP